MKNNKGITLIALVITIIVMLILVGVTISMSVNGGLFEKAGEAVRETNTKLQEEGKLAEDGRIKIGDKWYASIDDYINNNPITTGIEVTPTEIELKKNEEGAEGEEVLTGTITASVFGMESEPTIIWETSSDVITLSATSGRSITVTAAGTTSGVATVTAKCTYEGEEYTATSKVTLTILKDVTIARGDFVYYDVEYTDVYISEEFTTANGWRLLNYTDNGDGTISNVKLISTGIPAKLYYEGKVTTVSSWYVTDETKLTNFKEVLGGDAYNTYSGDASYTGLWASAGLYYNFGDIKFAYGTSSRGIGLGFFTSITVNETTYNSDNTTEKTGNDLFKVGSNVETVRLLTLVEVNEAIGRTDIDSLSQISETEDSIGLYRLDQNRSSYPSSTNWWLASPDPYEGNYRGLPAVASDGRIPNAMGYLSLGARPVIVLNSNISFSVDTETDETTHVTYLILTPQE